MLDSILNDSIIICSNDKKKYLLKHIKKLLNLKFLTMKQFLKLYLFDYDEKTVLYIIKKYNVTYDIALEYLDNIYYIEDKIYNNKLDFLVSLKKELIDNNLLIFDDNFKRSLKNKNVIIYEYPLNNFEKYVLKNIEYKVILDNIGNNTPVIYELNDIEDEIEFVAIKISELIHKNIPINKIKLTNINDNYINLIHKIFGFYNLKIDKNIKIPIISTVIGSTFYNNLDGGVESALDSIKDYQTTDIYNKIVDICNKFVWCKESSDLNLLIRYALKHSYIKDTKYNNTIEVVNYKNYKFTDEYVFMMSFNQGVIPEIKKDEDYISDDIKPYYLDNSIAINKFRKEEILNIIRSIPNLIITYKLKSAFSNFYPSNLIEDLNIEPIKYVLDYHKSYSSLSNKIVLAKHIDNLIKFGEYNPNLSLLNSNYKIDYNSYTNKFTGLNKNKLNNYINDLDTFNLSYSSIDNYNRCAFRFYIEKIINLKNLDNSFSKTLGNIYHYILSIYSKKDLDIEKEVYKYIEDKEVELSNSNYFFIKRAITDMQYLIQVLKEQSKYSNLDKEEKEKHITFNLKNNINFTGFIDKVIYNTFDDKVIAAIIDYKTYIKKPSLKYLDDGIGMQLPVYMLLAKKAYPNITFAGFYLQNITLDFKDDQTKYDSLKLIGYTNSDVNILEKLDKTYTDSLVIKGLKVKNDGSFTSNALKNMLSNQKIEELILKTDEKINETLENILEAKFPINPKYDRENIGCEFCSYRDICYMNDSNLVKIKAAGDEN